MKDYHLNRKKRLQGGLKSHLFCQLAGLVRAVEDLIIEN